MECPINPKELMTLKAKINLFLIVSGGPVTVQVLKPEEVHFVPVPARVFLTSQFLTSQFLTSQFLISQFLTSQFLTSRFPTYLNVPGPIYLPTPTLRLHYLFLPTLRLHYLFLTTRRLHYLFLTSIRCKQLIKRSMVLGLITPVLNSPELVGRRHVEVISCLEKEIVDVLSSVTTNLNVKPSAAFDRYLPVLLSQSQLIIIDAVDNTSQKVSITQNESDNVIDIHGAPLN